MSWLKSLYVTPPPIVYDFQAAPETGPFIAFKIGTIAPKGYDTKLGMNSSFLMNYGGLRVATVTISYFGYSPENSVALNYAMQNAQLISSSLEKTTIQQALSLQGYVYQHKNPVLNLTYLLESKYQPRADFDFYLGFVETTSDDDGFILTTKITGDVTVGEDVIHTENIVAPYPP